VSFAFSISKANHRKSKGGNNIVTLGYSGLKVMTLTLAKGGIGNGNNNEDHLLPL
jgi:hypothetical protein